MREKLQLHIPEPCHENWNQMTPVEQGRFCSSCQKNVIDFTAKDDEEILDFFKNYSGNTCGRFSNNQLNRPIEVIELKPASPFLKYAASLLLPALLFSTRGKSQFKEQLPKQVCEKPLNTTPSFRVRMGAVTSVSRNDLHNIKVEGVVMDQKGANVLPHTSVVIKGTNKGTITDLNGKFSLSTMDINGILVFSVVGYVSKELKVSDLILNPIQRILLTPASTGFLGEVIIVGMPVRKKKSIIAGAVTVLKKNSTLVEKLKDTLLFSKIKIYPNPVATSGTVNISFPKVKEGLYQIRLFNAAGQLFYSMQKQIGPGRDTEQLHLNSNMAQGIYLIQIIDSDNKLLQTSRLIVQ